MDTSNFPESDSLQRRKYSKIELSKNHTGTWRERVGEREEKERVHEHLCVKASVSASVC